MDLKIVNVIIDKKKFKDNNYHVLENALKYNIQRIENDKQVLLGETAEYEPLCRECYLRALEEDGQKI